MMIAQLWVALLLRIVVAVPNIQLPINSQVPPLAIVSQPFSYQFYLDTFNAPNGESLEYSLQNAPRWLSLNSETRTFSGNPDIQDIGPVSFQVSASDATGSIQDQVTFIVVKEQQISLGQSITPQLAGTGSLTNQTSVSLQQNAPLNLTFQKDTFQGPIVTYYATTADGSPLPSWISFNPQSLSFSGTTPASPDGLQQVDVMLIASTVAGFSSLSVTFTLTVGTHSLNFEFTQQQVNLSTGSPVIFSLLMSQLKLDGQPIQSQDLGKAMAFKPNWMTFDPRTLILAGQPPTGTLSTNVTIEANDTFGDKAQAQIMFRFHSEFFKREIGILNATIGRYFDYQVGQDLILQGNTSVTTSLGPAHTWLHFDPFGLTLSGVVPRDSKPEIIECNITVAIKGSPKNETQSFDIRLSNDTATADGSSNTSGATAVSEGDGHNSNPNSVSISTAGLVCAITIPAAGAFILILAILLCCLRRDEFTCVIRRKPRRLSKDDISAPIAGSQMKNQQRFEGEGVSVAYDLEKGPETSQISDGAPQIQTTDISSESDLRPSGYRSHRHSGHSILEEDEEEILRSQNRSSMGSGDLITQRPHHSRTYATDIARRSTKKAQSSNVKRRGNRLSHGIMGMPIDCTSMGMGHGRISRASFGSSWGFDNFPRRSNRLTTTSHKSASTGDSVSMQASPTKRFQGKNKDTAYDDEYLDYVKQRAKNRSFGPFFAAPGPRSRESSASTKPHQRASVEMSNPIKSPPVAAGRTWVHVSPIQEGFPRVISPIRGPSPDFQSDDLWDTASSNYTSTQELPEFADSVNAIPRQGSESGWPSSRNSIRQLSGELGRDPTSLGTLNQAQRHSISHLMRSPLSDLGSRAKLARRSAISETQVRAGMDEESSEVSSGPAFL